jgi:hypothetical protein
MNKLIYTMLTALLTVACGVSTTLTQPVNSQKSIVDVNVTPAAINATLTPYKVTKGMVVTLDELNVRACPSTNTAVCAVIGGYEYGARVEVGAMITNSDPICTSWYPTAWRGRIGWICADWTTK